MDIIIPAPNDAIVSGNNLRLILSDNAPMMGAETIQPKNTIEINNTAGSGFK